MDATITIGNDETMDPSTRERWHAYAAEAVGACVGREVQVRYDAGAIRTRFEGFDDEEEAAYLLADAWEAFAEIARELDDDACVEIAREAIRVRAYAPERDLWAHWDDATRRWYVVHRYALAALGDALRFDRSRPQDEREGDGMTYSRWCAGDFGAHRSEPAPEGWEPA